MVISREVAEAAVEAEVEAVAATQVERTAGAASTVEYKCSLAYHKCFNNMIVKIS